MSAEFSSLHPGIQRWIYDQRWGELRPIQADAITAFSESTDDVIISAPTASGKTEAAFLPILSAVAHRPGGSIKALYVGPLRALINDQFRRCEDLRISHKPARPQFIAMQRTTTFSVGHPLDATSLVSYHRA